MGRFLVFGLFHGSATILGSDRGQAGILIGSFVVAATAAFDWLLRRRQRGAAVRQLGLGRPRANGLVAAGSVALLLLPWPIAAASLLLAIVISFPMAHLFELGGDTIWAPALLHFVIQATVKVLVFAQGAESFALAWMAASAVVPLLVFAVKARRASEPARVGTPIWLG